MAYLAGDDEPYVERPVEGTDWTIVVQNPNYGDTPEDTSLFDLFNTTVGK